MRNICVLILSLFLTEITIAQDAHISQYYASPVMVNPATTGMFEGDYRGHIHYRTQWAAITPNPFITSSLVYDQPYERFGFGGYITNNKAGAGGLNYLTAVASAAYKITVDPQNIHNLTTGLQLGITHKSFSAGDLWFDNQYNTSTGAPDPALSNKENFIKTSIVIPEVNFGVYYYYDHPQKKFKPYIGLSGFHLTKPKEIFLGYENRLPIRLVTYGGSMIKFDEKISINPSLLFMSQTNNIEFQFGFMGYYNFEDSKFQYFFGPYYRNKDAVMIHTGVVYGEYVLRISYDVNVSPLSAVTRGQGGFEISVTYTKAKGKFVPSLVF